MHSNINKRFIIIIIYGNFIISKFSLRIVFKIVKKTDLEAWLEELYLSQNNTRLKNYSNEMASNLANLSQAFPFSFLFTILSQTSHKID